MDEKSDYYGEEHDVDRIDYRDGTVIVAEHDYYFLDQLQPIYPVEYNGVAIGFGDKLTWAGKHWKVHGCSWMCGEWGLDTTLADTDKMDGDGHWIKAHFITDHRSLHLADSTVSEAIKLLESKGYSVKKV